MFEGLFEPLHLIVVLVIVLLVFGPGRLPELGESLGKAIRGFKKGLEDPGATTSPKVPEQIPDRQPDPSDGGGTSAQVPRPAR
jgi:sec-independent protein translocase protein TatA